MHLVTWRDGFTSVGERTFSSLLRSSAGGRSLARRSWSSSGVGCVRKAIVSRMHAESTLLVYFEFRFRDQ